jgi:hypothetical protein
MEISELDLDREYERLRRILLMLDIQIDSEGLRLWHERVAEGHPPFPVKALGELEAWAAAILDRD